MKRAVEARMELGMLDYYSSATVMPSVDRLAVGGNG